MSPMTHHRRLPQAAAPGTQAVALTDLTIRFGTTSRKEGRSSAENRCEVAYSTEEHLPQFIPSGRIDPLPTGQYLGELDTPQMKSKPYRATGSLETCSSTERMMVVLPPKA